MLDVIKQIKITRQQNQIAYASYATLNWLFMSLHHHLNSELSSCSPLAWLPGREDTPANALTALSAQLDEKVFPSRGKTFAVHNQRWKGDIICNHPTVIEYVLYLRWKNPQKKSNAFLHHMVVVKTTPSGVVKWSIHMILAAWRLGLQLRLRCWNRGSSNITTESTEWFLFIFLLSCAALLVLLWLSFVAAVSTCCFTLICEVHTFWSSFARQRQTSISSFVSLVSVSPSVLTQANKINIRKV